MKRKGSVRSTCGVWKSSIVKNGDLAQLVQLVVEKNDHFSGRIEIGVYSKHTNIHARSNTREDIIDIFAN